MSIVIILLIISALLYVCNHIERNDPIYWDMCHGVHPVLRILLSPICLLIRLLH